MKITKSQLKEIIKEEVSRLQKKTVLESRVKEINRELRMLNEDDKVVTQELFGIGKKKKEAAAKAAEEEKKAEEEAKKKEAQAAQAAQAAKWAKITVDSLANIAAKSWENLDTAYDGDSFTEAIERSIARACGAEGNDLEDKFDEFFKGRITSTEKEVGGGKEGKLLVGGKEFCSFKIDAGDEGRDYGQDFKVSDCKLDAIKPLCKELIDKFKPKADNNLNEEELDMSDIDMSIEDKAVFSAMNDEEVEDDLSDIIAKYTKQGGDYEGGYKDDVSVSPGYLSESNKKGKMKITKSQLKQIIREEVKNQNLKRYSLHKYLLDNDVCEDVSFLSLLDWGVEAIKQDKDKVWNYFENLQTDKLEKIVNTHKEYVDGDYSNEQGDLAGEMGLRYSDSLSDEEKEGITMVDKGYDNIQSKGIEPYKRKTNYAKNKEAERIKREKFASEFPEEWRKGEDDMFYYIGKGAWDFKTDEVIPVGYGTFEDAPEAIERYRKPDYVSWKNEINENKMKITKSQLKQIIREEVSRLKKQTEGFEDFIDDLKENNIFELFTHRVNGGWTNMFSITPKNDAIKFSIIDTNYSPKISSIYHPDDSDEKELGSVVIKRNDFTSSAEAMKKVQEVFDRILNKHIEDESWRFDEEENDKYHDFSEDLYKSLENFMYVLKTHDCEGYPHFNGVGQVDFQLEESIKKRKIKITKSQLKQIIREEASRLKKQYILEDKKKAITEELRMLNEDDKVVTQELFGIGKKKKEAAAKAAEEEKKAEEEAKKKEAQAAQAAQVAKWAKITPDSLANIAAKSLERGEYGYDGRNIRNIIEITIEEACGVKDDYFEEFFKNRLTATEKDVEGGIEGKVLVDGKEFCSFKIFNEDAEHDYGDFEVSDCKLDAIKPLFKELVDKFKPKADNNLNEEEDANVAVEFDVEVPDWLVGKLEQVHTKPGQGSIFAKPIKSVLELVKSHLSKMNPQEVEKIANSTGTVSLDSSGIGYDLVLPMDKAKTLKDAQQVEVEKIEGPNKIKVPAIKTSEDMGAFSTGKLTIIVRPKKDDSGNVLKGQYIVLSAFPGNPDIPRASEWGGKYAVIIPNAQMNESIRKIVREGIFSILNEDVEFKGEFPDKKELFDKIKKDLLTIDWIKDGQIDADHYELFGRDDSDELEQAVEWGEISSNIATELVQDVLEDKYKGHGIVVDVDNRLEGDNLWITLKADDDNWIGFQIDYAL